MQLTPFLFSFVLFYLFWAAASLLIEYRLWNARAIGPSLIGQPMEPVVIRLNAVESRKSFSQERVPPLNLGHQIFYC